MIPTTNTHILGRHLPNARVRIYADAGHGFLFQFPTEFAALVAKFLSWAIDRALELPQGALARHARELDQQHEDSSLHNHSVRSYIFSRIVSAAKDLHSSSDFDEQVVYDDAELACISARLGIKPAGS